MERLTIVTQPASEPVTSDEAKLHLRVDFADDDALIASLIVAARLMVETELRQALITQTVRLDLDETPNGGGYYDRQIRRAGPTMPYWLPTSTFPIPLLRPPVQSITSVQFYDYTDTLQTIDPSTYVFEAGTPARLAPKFGHTWPVAEPRIGAYRVTYVVGYGDAAAAVPEPAKVAIKLLLTHLYENRGDSSVAMPDAAKAVLATLDHGSYS